MGRVVPNRNFKREMGQPASCRKWQRAAGEKGRIAIQSAAPRQTGFLKTTVTYEESRRGPSVRFRANVGDPPYSLFQEVGTGIYGPLKRYITPKRARFLSWLDADTGDRVFAKRVRGSRPRRYFEVGLKGVFQRVRYYGQTGGRGAQKG